MARDKERILDGYLVASARLGDRNALGIMARRWNGKFVAHAWRLLRDDEAAKDAVQESWTEIMRGLPRLRDEGAFAAWAYRIVSRRCARRIARIQGERRFLEDFSTEPAEVSGAEPASMDGDAINRAIKSLPPEQQAAVALFYLEDMGVAEVAVALDVPAGTVKTRLMHARRKLRLALEGDE